MIKVSDSNHDFYQIFLLVLILFIFSYLFIFSIDKNYTFS